MGKPAVSQEVIDRSHGPRLFVPRTKDQPRHAGGQNRARAHGTRFQRDYEGHIVEPPRPEVGGGIAQSQYLGVCRGVARLFAAITAPPNYRAVFVDNHGTHGNIVRVFRGARLGERKLHPRFFSWGFCGHVNLLVDGSSLCARDSCTIEQPGLVPLALNYLV